MKIWKSLEIEKLLQNDTMIERSIIQLYQKQTAEEQLQFLTKDNNRQGFNCLDASFGTSLAIRIKNGWQLSSAQVEAARKMLKKYVGQLTNIANDKL